MITPARFILLGVLALLLSLTAWAKPVGFFIEALPKGKDVTLQPPAVTYVPLAERVSLSATDLPQTVKLSAVHLNDGQAVAFSVTIYDKRPGNVKRIVLNPGMSYHYSFKDISTISVVPEIPALKSGQYKNQYGLRLESDKSMQLTR